MKEFREGVKEGPKQKYSSPEKFASELANRWKIFEVLEEVPIHVNASDIIKSIARITKDLKNRGYPDEWIEWKLEGILRDLDISDRPSERNPLYMSPTNPIHITKENIIEFLNNAAKVLEEQDDKP